MTKYESISLSSKPGPVADNPWIDAAFTVNEPWPANARIQGYDAQPNADGFITMNLSNGWAKYRVVNKAEWGAFDCEYVDGEYRSA
jgi:hypothetical protein